jgi:hypothetical protein
LDRRGGRRKKRRRKRRRKRRDRRRRRERKMVGSRRKAIKAPRHKTKEVQAPQWVRPAGELWGRGRQGTILFKAQAPAASQRQS